MKKNVCLFLLALLAVLNCSAQMETALQGCNSDLNLLFIGNSITFGAGLPDREQQAPPVVVQRLLAQEAGIGDVRMENAAVSGSTTFDFLPGSGRYYEQTLDKADRLARHPGLMLISIMLGTNDSAESGPTGAPVSPERYIANLQMLLDTLSNRYPQAEIVLHRPIWYSPNTQNAAVYLQQGLDRLCSYSAPLEALVAQYQQNGNTHIALGDTRGFELFRTEPERLFQPEEGKNGIFRLHPNPEGAELLGQLWAEELQKAVWRRFPLPASDERYSMQLNRYAEANRLLVQNPEVVFMGDSITDFWVNNHPDFFASNNFADRGISGQITGEMLVRFRSDVIELKPKVVVILAGINDIARNSGYIDLKYVFGNIVSMCELAKCNGIGVVLCSLTPCSRFSWRQALRPASSVRVLNSMLKRYAEDQQIPYVDYYSAMADEIGGLPPYYSGDGCHPNADAYSVMEPLVLDGIRTALKNN